MRVDIQKCHQFRYPAVLADHSSGLFVLGKIGQSLGRHFSDPQIVMARRRRQLVIKPELVNTEYYIRGFLMRHLSKLMVNSIPPITVICCRTPEWRVILRIIFNDPILHFLSSVSSRLVSTSNPPVNMRNHTTVIVICFNSQSVKSCLPP